MFAHLLVKLICKNKRLCSTNLCLHICCQIYLQKNRLSSSHLCLHICCKNICCCKKRLGGTLDRCNQLWPDLAKLIKYKFSSSDSVIKVLVIKVLVLLFLYKFSSSNPWRQCVDHLSFMITYTYINAFIIPNSPISDSVRRLSLYIIGSRNIK